MPDDIIFALPSQVKARTEEIVIRNQPGQQRVDLYQALRPIAPDGTMGQPVKHFMSSKAVNATLLTKEYDGVTGMQVLQWLTAFANEVTTADAPAQVSAMAGG